MKKALVVLSGGQDSTSTLIAAIASKSYDEVHAVTFDYGQRHRLEIHAAVNVAKLLGLPRARHTIIEIPAVLRSTSPLVAKAEVLEQYSSHAQMEAVIGNRVEKTFVPMRNALFLTVAANLAVAIGATSIHTGVCQNDNANYPDCREPFIIAQERAINEALGFHYDAESWISIVTPFLHVDKADQIRFILNKAPRSLPVLAFTHTAYDGQYPPTGRDHANVLRAEAFMRAGVPDPLVVRANMEGLMLLPNTDNYDHLKSSVDLPGLMMGIHTLGEELRASSNAPVYPAELQQFPKINHDAI